ncbi:nucleoprotein TPR [Acrasis kona]|uniref:Nucleoprotein TPR n=2 Tax=Acrasis kona TaxID=1008807 RepID=A0AAW2Z5M4_9EUKA
MSEQVATGSDQMDADLIIDWENSLVTEEEFEQLKADPLQLLSQCNTRSTENFRRTETTLKNEIEKLKSEKNLDAQTQRDQSETELNALERRNEKFREERNAAVARSEELESRILSLDEIINEFKDNVSSLKQKIAHQARDLEEAQSQLEKTKDEKVRQLTSFSKKDEEVRVLNDDLSKLTEKYKALNRQKIEFEDRLNEANTATIPLNFTIDKIKHEKKLVEDQNAFLNESLQKLSNEFLQSKSQMSVEIIKARGEHSAAVEQIKQLEFSKATLTANNNSLQSRADAYLTEIRDLRNDFENQTLSLKRELEAAKHLSQLSESRQSEAEQSLLQVRKESSDQKEKYNKHIALLNQDLDKYKQINNTLSEEFELLKKNNSSSLSSPLRVSALTKGISSSDIYSKFVSVSEENIELKRENNTLKASIDAIQEEILEFEPLSEAQRSEHERLQMSHVNLTRELRDTKEKLKTFTSQVNTFKKKNIDLTAANAALSKEHAELYEQVNMLLIECRNYKLTLNESANVTETEISLMAEDDNYDPNEPVQMSFETITFKDVTQLQNQLRSALRNLRESEVKHRHQLESIRSEESNNIESQIKSYQDRVNKLKDDSKRQFEKYNLVVKERDYFRELNKQHLRVNKKSSFDSQPLSFDLNQSIQSSSSSTNNTSQIDFENQKNEFINEIETYKSESQKLKIERLQLQNQLSNKSNEVAHYIERLNQTNILLQNSTTEIQNLRQHSTCQSQSLQNAIRQQDKLRDEMNQIQHKMNDYTNQISHYKSESNYLKQQNDQLSKDREELRQSRDQTEKFYNNLQQIQSTMSLNDKKQVEKTILELDQIKSQLEVASEKLEQERILTREANIQLELKQSECRDLLASKDVLIGKLKEEIASDSSKLESYQRENRSLSTRINILEQRLDSSNSSSSITSSSSSNQLDSVEVEALKRDLESSRSLVQEKKSQHESLLNQLKESESSRTHLLTELESTNQSHQISINDYKSQIEQLQSALDVESELLVAEKNQLIQSNEKISELTSRYESLISELNMIKESQRSEKSVVESSQDQIQQYQKSYQEQKEKFENLLKQYSSDVTKMNELENSNASLREEFRLITLQFNNQNQQLNGMNEQFKSRESALKNVIEDSNQRIRDLERQRDILLSENEILNVELKRAVLPDVTQSSSSTTNLERDQVEELREMVRFVRKDKDMISSKLSVVEFESARNRQMYEQSARDLERCRSDFELFKNQIESTKSIDDSTLQQLDLLKESNQALRHNYEQLTKQFDLEKLQRQQAQDSYEPLHKELLTSRGQVNVLEKEISNLQKDVEHWQRRSQSLIEKYKQIDPKEHSDLKLECEEKTNRIDELNQQVIDLKSKLESSEHLTKRQDLEKIGELESKIVDLEQKVKSLNRAGLNWKNKFEALSKSDEELKKENEELNSKLELSNKQLESVKSQLSEKSDQSETTTAEHWKGIYKTKLQKFKSENETKIKNLDKLKTEAQEKIVELEKENLELSNKLSEQKTKLVKTMRLLVDMKNKYKDQEEAEQEDDNQQEDDQQEQEEQQQGGDEEENTSEKEVVAEEKAPVVEAPAPAPAPAAVLSPAEILRAQLLNRINKSQKVSSPAVTTPTEITTPTTPVDEQEKSKKRSRVSEDAPQEEEGQKKKKTKIDRRALQSTEEQESAEPEQDEDNE